MIGILISYPSGDEILLGETVELCDDGAVRISAPNGMTHVVMVKDVVGVARVSNAHNLLLKAK